MKTLKLIILGIFVLYFQIIFSIHFVVYNLIPNFLIAYIIYLSINSGLRTTLSISFIWGLAIDLLQPHYLGINSLIFIIISFIVNKFHESINKRRLIMVSISIFMINLLYYFIFGFYQMIALHDTSDFSASFILLVIYNTIVTIFSVYFLLVLSRLKIVIDV